MIIKIPEQYSNIFFKREGDTEQQDLIYDECKLIDALSEAQQHQFNVFLNRYNRWLSEQLQNAYVAGAAAGAKAIYRAPPCDNTIRFVY